MKTRFFLSLGSNIEPEHHIPACLEILKKDFTVLKISNIYETQPVGPMGSGKFWNAAVEIESDLTPVELGKELRKVEAGLGRKRDPKNKFAPRTIDIDLIPQPDYQQQGFIMVPLAEIAPHEKDPETGKSFFELAENFKEEKKKFRKIIL